MTRNEIIEKLYKDDRINNCISKMHPIELQEDLKSEIFLILLEYPKSKIKELYSKNQLVYFTLKIITNQVKSNNSKFTKTYKDKNVHYGIEFTDMASDNSEYFEKIPESFNNLVSKIKGIVYKSPPDYIEELFPEIGWYKQLMLSIYMKHKTYQSMEDWTKIPIQSCYKTVKETIKQLRDYAGR